jgi:membrane protein DedA with SNARE-associated domain
MPGVRTFISLPAGIAKMPVVRFFCYSALGALPWNAGLAYLGWAAGRAAGGDEASWAKLQEQFGRYDLIFYLVLGVLVLALVGWGVWRWRRRRNAKKTEEV